MELRDIKALVALMQDCGLLELEIEDKKGRLRLVRGELGGGQAVLAGSAATLPNRATPAPVAAGKPAPSSVAAEQAGQAPKGPTVSELARNQQLVTSPMVGTFYRAPSPDSAPLVEEGDLVRKGQVLCIIEAMKMMNEIEAEVAGRMVRILCENGQPVEYGQPLMILEVG